MALDVNNNRTNINQEEPGTEEINNNDLNPPDDGGGKKSVSERRRKGRRIRAAKTEQEHRDSLWPPKLHKVFLEALEAIPEYGRKKLVSSRTGLKTVGRNELISEYMFEKSGIFRSVKQVASHLQVYRDKLTKKIRKEQGELTKRMRTSKKPRLPKRYPRRGRPRKNAQTASASLDTGGLRFWDPDSGALLASISTADDLVAQLDCSVALPPGVASLPEFRGLAFGTVDPTLYPLGAVAVDQTYIGYSDGYSSESVGYSGYIGHTPMAQCPPVAWDPIPCEEGEKVKMEWLDDPEDPSQLLPLIPNSSSESVSAIREQTSESQPPEYHQLKSELDWIKQEETEDSEFSESNRKQLDSNPPEGTLEIQLTEFEIFRLTDSRNEVLRHVFAGARLTGPISEFALEDRAIEKVCKEFSNFAVRQMFGTNLKYVFYGINFFLNLGCFPDQNFNSTYLTTQRLESCTVSCVKVRTTVSLFGFVVAEQMEVLEGETIHGSSFVFELRNNVCGQLEEFFKKASFIGSYKGRQKYVEHLKIVQTVSETRTDRLLLCILMSFDATPFLDFNNYQCFSCYRIV